MGSPLHSLHALAPLRVPPKRAESPIGRNRWGASTGTVMRPPELLLELGESIPVRNGVLRRQRLGDYPLVVDSNNQLAIEALC